MKEVNSANGRTAEPPKYKILALFGKSSSGKDTIETVLVQSIPHTKRIISHTTRPPRDYEINHQDYHFVSTEYFTNQMQQGLMLETTSFRNWLYGTSLEELSYHDINIGVFNIQGINTLLTNTKLQVLPVLIDAPPKIRLVRSITRELNPDCTEICRRFLKDETDFKTIPFSYEYFKNTTNNVLNILNNSVIKNFLMGNNN